MEIADHLSRHWATLIVSIVLPLASCIRLSTAEMITFEFVTTKSSANIVTQGRDMGCRKVHLRLPNIRKAELKNSERSHISGR